MADRDAAAQRGEDEWAGTVLELRVIEAHRYRNRAIVSESAAADASDASAAGISEGDIRTGRVKRASARSIFMDVDGVPGVVPRVEASWLQTAAPARQYQAGDEVAVRVIKADGGAGALTLSIRQAAPEPWLDAVAELSAGQVVPATVSTLSPFGAFARIGEAVEGLIHVSRTAGARNRAARGRGGDRRRDPRADPGDRSRSLPRGAQHAAGGGRRPRARLGIRRRRRRDRRSRGDRAVAGGRPGNAAPPRAQARRRDDRNGAGAPRHGLGDRLGRHHRLRVALGDLVAAGRRRVGPCNRRPRARGREGREHLGARRGALDPDGACVGMARRGVRVPARPGRAGHRARGAAERPRTSRSAIASGR